MAGGRGVPPGARRTYSRGAGGISEHKLGAAVYRSPLLKFRHTPTQAQIYAQKTLEVAAQFTREITTWEKINCTQLAGRSGWTWRDQFYASLFGTALEFTDTNGVSWTSRRALAMQIQQLLDSISSNPGSILVRTATAWAALYPGSNNQVMTINPLTGLPDWQAATAGGGGGLIPTEFTSTGTAGDLFASLGYYFTFPIPCTLTALQAILNPGAVGRTYDLFCAPFDTTTHTITAQPTRAGTFTATATGGPQNVAMNLPAPIYITAGDTYAFWITQTFGSSTTTPDTYYSLSPIESFYFAVPTANGLKLASNAPTPADTWTTASALWAINFLYGAPGVSPFPPGPVFAQGTWTPRLGGLTTDPTGVTYVRQWGTYTRIGNAIFFEFRLQTSSLGAGGAGIVLIKDLPFLPITGGGAAAVACPNIGFIATPAGYTSPTMLVDGINNYFSIAWTGNNVLAAQTTFTDLGAGMRVTASGLYYRA